jgi:hypothetical protein
VVAVILWKKKCIPSIHVFSLFNVIFFKLWVAALLEVSEHFAAYLQMWRYCAAIYILVVSLT